MVGFFFLMMETSDTKSHNFYVGSIALSQQSRALQIKNKNNLKGFLLCILCNVYLNPEYYNFILVVIIW